MFEFDAVDSSVEDLELSMQGPSSSTLHSTPGTGTLVPAHLGERPPAVGSAGLGPANAQWAFVKALSYQPPRDREGNPTRSVL